MPHNYFPLLQEQTPGLRILLAADDDRGDGSSALVLVRHGDRFGYLSFGWGSCSACDAFDQARDDGPDAVTALAASLTASIHWEADAYALAHWLAHRDWPLQWEGNTGLVADFVPAALLTLAPLAGRPVPQLPTN